MSRNDVKLQIDHKVPISKGGKIRNEENLITSCEHCNRGKRDTLIKQWEGLKNQKEIELKEDDEPLDMRMIETYLNRATKFKKFYISRLYSKKISDYQTFSRIVEDLLQRGSIIKDEKRIGIYKITPKRRTKYQGSMKKRKKGKKRTTPESFMSTSLEKVEQAVLKIRKERNTFLLWHVDLETKTINWYTLRNIMEYLVKHGRVVMVNKKKGEYGFKEVKK